MPFWKKAFFGLVTTVGFFLMLELLLLAVGPPVADERVDPYPGFASYQPLFETEEDGNNGNNGPSLVTAPSKLNLFNVQRFPREKNPGVYRCFCLGGSTTYGRPYEDSTSFCGWLRELLPAAEPDRRWEVINAGGISYASYRVAKVMEELVDYEPDLFVIYCGHNEFLERRTYQGVFQTPSTVRNLTALLARTRTGALIGRMLPGPASDTERASGKNVLPAEVDAILDRSIGPDAYVRDEAFREQVLGHYRASLVRMIQIARGAEVQVILVVPASNLRDFSPFKSQHRGDLTGDELNAWSRAFEGAEGALQAKRYKDARRLAKRAVHLDPRHAHGHWLLGQALWHLGEYEPARKSFVRARNEDICPLRALSEQLEVIREVAQEHDVALVDFNKIAEARATNGVPGTDLFLDHVHPTIAANRLLAVSILSEMVRLGIVEPVPNWGQNMIAEVAQRVEAGLDRTTHAGALRNLAKVLAWAGKFDEANRLSLQAVEHLPEDANALCMAGDALYNQGRFEEAIAYYERAVDIRPNYATAIHGLATCEARQGELTVAEKYFRQAVRLAPDDAFARFDFANFLHDQGRFDEAADQYEATLRIDSAHTAAHKNLGMILASQGSLNEAIAHFRQAIRIKPNEAELHNDLAFLLIERGDLEEALNAVVEALRLNPGFGRALLARGLIHERQGELQAAAADYRELIRLSPDDPDALFRLGNLLFESQQLKDAAECYEQLVRIVPDYPGAKERLRQVQSLISTDP